MNRISSDSAWVAVVAGLCVVFALFFLLPFVGLFEHYFMIMFYRVVL